eukprot:c23061_g1_i1 orf=1663-3459(-)
MAGEALAGAYARPSMLAPPNLQTSQPSSSFSSRLAINSPDSASRLCINGRGFFPPSPCLSKVCRSASPGLGGCSYLLRRGARHTVIRSDATVAAAVVEKAKVAEMSPDVKGLSQHFSIVMKFGGSSVASAARMREVADLVLSFPEETPIVVLSAMGKTTNNLLQAGETAVCCGVAKSCTIKELSFVKELHLSTAKELGVDAGVITELLEELSQLLTGIALMKELTNRTRDYLVSFGERLSTKIFAAYLRLRGVKARQYDAFDIGFITTDEFTNADILEATYPAVAKRLSSDWSTDPGIIPIVTGFLGKGQKTGATTTLGRGGSDLTATALGKALGLREIQVWKDVDGVLTCDPNIHPAAMPVPYLTYDEAAELAYFGAQVLHPQSMRPAREGNVPVRVKNSYNPQAPGTLIQKSRDLSESFLTSIVVKRNVTMLDIVSTRMLGQFGFLARVFTIFEKLGISVDVVATSEVSISLTLDPSKLWSRELIQQASELDHMVQELENIAFVKLLQKRSIISLIGNVERSSSILEKVFCVFREKGVNVQMISQGASKVNISLIVNDDEAEFCVKALHAAFFETSRATESAAGCSLDSTSLCSAD